MCGIGQRGQETGLYSNMQRRIFLLLLAASALLRAQNPRPHVLLISIDGFRYDYAAKHGAPNLIRLGQQGVRAEALIPQVPSKTFPNHLSIVTGLRPEHHGILDNEFFDPARNATYSYKQTATDGSWYKGTPLWVLAEHQGVRTAAFFWPGSDAEIQGVRPRDYRRYEEAIPNAERVRQVIDWFARPESVRPHFVTLYFSDVDSAGHRSGPDGAETKEAVQRIDALLGQLMEGLRATGPPVNVIVLSDHGMMKAPDSNGGTHGPDPHQVPEMRGIFYAQGPDLKSGVTLPAFENIDVYPLIAKLLRLTPPGELDGKADTLSEILK